MAQYFGDKDKLNNGVSWWTLKKLKSIIRNFGKSDYAHEIVTECVCPALVEVTTTL